MADRRRRLVLVDARLARRRRTGVATYVRELRAALEAADPADLRVQWLFGPPGLPRRGRLTTLGNLALDLGWVHLWLPLTAWRRRASVVHAPMNWAPWWCPCPTVVTVQDISWERLPDAYPRGFRRYARIFARRSARTARVVLTTSGATARDLMELYGVPPERIRVEPIGVAPDRGPARAREPFVLHVGEFEPRKRVLDLIEGHRRYHTDAPADPPPCRLVLAGSGGSQEPAVRRAAAESPACEALGFVSAEALADLYRRATLLVFPSAYEGFGLPAAEAMAHGCPTLLARTSGLIEVGGTTALYLDEATPDAIARALTDALTDREDLAARGEEARRDAERFSWPRAAAGTIGAYRRAMR